MRPFPIPFYPDRNYKETYRLYPEEFKNSYISIMPAPSQLSIATSSVRRLLKEEASYHKELAAEEKKLQELEQQASSGEGAANDDDGNQEFLLKQHVSSRPPFSRDL